MASVNKWIGIGNLGKDPDVRYSAIGDAICNFSIACTESWKDKATGEKKEQTEWVRISFFGKLAEICGQYLKKGSQVYIEGSMRTRKWTDKDSQRRNEAHRERRLVKRHSMTLGTTFHSFATHAALSGIACSHELRNVQANHVSVLVVA